MGFICTPYMTKLYPTTFKTSARMHRQKLTYTDNTISVLSEIVITKLRGYYRRRTGVTSVLSDGR